MAEDTDSGAIVIKRTYKAVPRLRPRTGASGRAFVTVGSMGNGTRPADANPQPTKEEFAALLAALDEADAAARRALNQAERNVLNLRDARLEAETARAIAASSNEMAAALAGVAS